MAKSRCLAQSFGGIKDTTCNSKIINNIWWPWLLLVLEPRGLLPPEHRVLKKCQSLFLASLYREGLADRSPLISGDFKNKIILKMVVAVWARGSVLTIYDLMLGNTGNSRVRCHIHYKHITRVCNPRGTCKQRPVVCGYVDIWSPKWLL